MTKRRPWNALDVPPEFMELAPVLGTKKLAERLGRSESAVRAWRRAHGIPSPKREKVAKPEPKRPVMPNNFGKIAAELPTSVIAERLGISRNTVRNWRRLCGIPSPGRCLGPAKPKARKATSGTPIFAYKPAPVTIHRDQSVAGRAVSECLQKLGRIFRCDEEGRQDRNGSLWNRNGFILTDDDVIDRARRNGWSPDAWERIAA